MEYIRYLWQGREKLWKVFWIYNILWLFVLNSVASLLIDAAPSDIAAWAVYVIFQLVTLFLVLARWKCAFNTSWIGWGIAARGYILICFVLVALEIVGVL